MIPYDDLVNALQAWRARQGLPVNQVAGAGSGPTPKPASGPHAKPGSGPNAKPPAPPPAPPRAEEPIEVADELLDENAYENEGSDFAVAFGAGGGGGENESTQIGGAPERPTEADLGKDRDDW